MSERACLGTKRVRSSLHPLLNKAPQLFLLTCSLVLACFIKNAPRFISLGAEENKDVDDEDEGDEDGEIVVVMATKRGRGDEQAKDLDEQDVIMID